MTLRFFENIGIEENNWLTVSIYGHGYYTKGKKTVLATANHRWRKSGTSKKINDQQIGKSNSSQSSPQIQDFSNSSTNVILLNSQGIANKKTELTYLISIEKPDVLCIQETMFSKQTNFNLKNYKGLLKEGHTNYWAHGGVAIFIHKTIPYQKLILKTFLQAITARF